MTDSMVNLGTTPVRGTVLPGWPSIRTIVFLLALGLTIALSGCVSHPLFVSFPHAPGASNESVPSVDDRDPQPVPQGEPSVTPTLPNQNSSEAGAGEAHGAKAEPTLTEVPFVEEKPDDKPVFELRGRIEAEAIFASQSERNQAIIGNLQNAVGFRRARLGAQGTVGEQVRWVAEFDFAGGNIAFKDVYLAIDQLPVIREFRVGHFREPFSLEGATSSNYFTFEERSPVNALDPARNWGVGIFSYAENERLTFAAGAFRSGTNNAGNDIGDGNDMAYTTRLTCLPWYDAASGGAYLMHLGAAFSQRYPKDDVVTFRQGPRSSLLQFADDPLTPFVPDVTIPASQNQLYNLQWATVLGPLSFQAEWSATGVDQIGGGPVFLHGSYVFASFFLTGEHREYLTKQGTFGLTKVRSPFLCLKGKRLLAGGLGAWELTARFSYLNFSSANLPPAANGEPQGSRLAEGTLGVNWYLNDHARIMFNFDHAVPVIPDLGPSSASAYSIRSAIFW
jgi:phosphate-selective porin OprO/OprP